MHMNRIKICGGYGEHGRSCFLVEYTPDGHYYMLDCGIMDTDPQPNPHVTKEEIAKTDYVFLSHCHKDHAGAFAWLVEMGFQGILVTTAMTRELAEIDYKRVELLELAVNTISEITLPKAEWGQSDWSGLRIQYGRTGHCPGSLWFQIADARQTVFYSGDYQKRPYLYACDEIIDMAADLAILDLAHVRSELDAGAMREVLWEQVGGALKAGRRVILPVPKYGRGLEMAAFFMDRLAKAEKQNGLLPGGITPELYVDSDFVIYEKKMQGECWYQREPAPMYHGILDTEQRCAAGKRLDMPCIILIADTHLVKPANADFVLQESASGAQVIITGRVRTGSVCEQLLSAGQAQNALYPHHQSRHDFEELVRENAFRMVLPFHNGEKEVWMSE
ncbi:MAG: MBL fold metallo-hydrolase [Lachnospiraceae bacterium]|nr:MBL fold metallo-hydrolase [Lachnospiraceae bacterium]